MLRNRYRSVTKQSPIMADHQSPNISSPNTQNPTRFISSFLGAPKFFNGFLLTKAPESTPTSILDAHKQIPSFGSNPFRFAKSPEKPTKVFQEIKHPSEKFDSEGIALALEENPRGDFCKPNAINRKDLFGANLKIQIPSLKPSAFSPNGSPNSPGDFGIKTRNSQFSGAPTPIGSGSPRGPTGPMSLSEMELSEEYTRVVSHGPNPKTTHIYDNCVVESCCGVVGSTLLKMEPGPKSPCESFLSSCHTCRKNLGEGSDIFMYRGEKAFCSEECRCQEMLLDGLINS